MSAQSILGGPSSSATDSSQFVKKQQSRSGWRWLLAQILVLSAAVLIAYVWIISPVLSQFSLEAFAGCILLYFILKKLNGAALWQILPSTAVDEMMLVTFAFLLLIGATGGAESALFPLIFIYLFFLSMTMRLPTAIILSLEVMLFLYALAPNLSPALTLTLINIPVVMIFFLFAKYQYDQAKEKQMLIEIDSQEINSYQIYLQHKDAELDQAKDTTWSWIKFFNDFVFGFLQPKIDLLIELAKYPQNHNAVQGQLTLVRIELEKLKKQLNDPALEALRQDQQPADGKGSRVEGGADEGSNKVAEAADETAGTADGSDPNPTQSQTTSQQTGRTASTQTQQTSQNMQNV